MTLTLAEMGIDAEALRTTLRTGIETFIETRVRLFCEDLVAQGRSAEDIAAQAANKRKEVEALVRDAAEVLLDAVRRLDFSRVDGATS